MGKYIVVYDSCILYSFTLRNLFVDLAMSELFQAKWTDEIHQEWIQNLLKNNPNSDPSKLQKLKEILNNSVTDCLVKNYQSLTLSLSLPDNNDCHILAAAIYCGAQAIITNNLNDFPIESLNQYHIEALNPDTFIKLQMELSLGKILTAIKKSRQRLKNPSYSPDEYLICLRKKGLIETTTLLREYKELI